MSEEDRNEQNSSMLLYKMGIGAMVFSFFGSFYFSRRIIKEPKNVGKLIMMNFGQTCVNLYAFLAFVWKKGKVESRMADKYLYMLNDYEL